MKMKRKRKKLMTLLILILFSATLLLSMTYIVLESDHDCIGAICPVCKQIHMIERFIGYLGISLSILFCIFLAFEIYNKSPLHIKPLTIALTPVAWNIRMNN